MEFFDLTNPQKAIWLTEQFYKGKNINNICGTFLIDTIVDFEKLEEALNIFIRDNDSLRINLKLDENGDIKQYFKTFSPHKFEIVELSSNNDLIDLETRLVNSRFNVIDNNLFNIVLFKLPNNKGGFVINTHHLIADACALTLVASKVANIYSSLINNKDNTEAPASYIDYINSENTYLSSNKFLKDKTYWEDKFENLPEIGIIPSVKNSSLDSPSAKRELFKLDTDKVKKINEFCSQNKISVFNFFMAVYAIYISRVSHLDSFVLGTPILNRANAVEKNTPGMFISTVPFRFDITDNVSFMEFISNIAKDSLGMLRHQKYPYQNILEFARTKNPNQPNLYDVLISYQNAKTNKNSANIPYEVKWSFNGNIPDSMQIHLFDVNDESALNIAYDYRLNKYNKSDISNLHKRILFIIEQVLSNKSILLKDIEIVTPSEENLILNTFNKTKHRYNKKLNVIDLFERQVIFSRSKTALVSNGVTLTYKELNEKANLLAHYIKNNLDINPNDIVGIMVTRSPEMIIGLLAILKCGATYLPIDSEYPKERILYMLENSNTKLVLVNNDTEKKLSVDYYYLNISLDNPLYNGRKNRNNLDLDINPNSLFCLIYTSGSTGKPKGVMIKHSNLNNFVTGIKKMINFSRNKVLVSLTTICFDIFGLEVWCTLTSGMTLVLANEEEQNITESLNKLCLENHVNIMQTTPSRYKHLLSDKNNLDFMKSITDIITAGEPLPENLLMRFKKLSSANIYNMYGPTETTIMSTGKNLTKSNSISIGKPIANTQCYILDKNQKLLPPYTPGDLYIGGDGICAGYSHRRNLTEQKFTKSPFKFYPYNSNDNAPEPSRIYNTNDLAYYTDEGEIIHLGRSDFQVKIRGYRIELGEIENQILKFSPKTQECIVAPIFNNQRLCAYYTGDELDTALAQKSLQDKLPTYMIPNYFIKLDSFPHTPNGKIDRKAIKFDEAYINNEIVMPKNDIEQKLYDIIVSVCHKSEFSMTDNLFNIGLDSIDIMRLSVKIQNAFSVQVNITDMYKINSIIDLANTIKSSSINSITISKAKIAHTYPLSFAQSRIYYATKMYEDSVLYNIPGGMLVNTILDTKKIENAFKQLIQLHSSFRTCFKIENDKPVQLVLDDVDFEIEIKNSKEKDLKNIIDNFPKAFNLENAPLLRVTVHLLDNKKTLILIDSHHIIVDGSSLNILIHDFCKLYNNLEIDKTKLEYKDYAVWENNYINSDSIKENENYWVNNFKNNEIPVINLPYDYSIPATPSYVGNKVSVKLSKDIFDEFNKIAKTYNCSTYMVFLAAFYVLLYKYTSQDNIIIGSPIANRDLSGLENIVGMFVNNIALNANIDSSKTFKDFLTEIKAMVLGALEHQPYPYDLLVKKLNLGGRNLFDIMFTYQNTKKDTITLENKELEIIEANTKTSKFNLSLEIVPNTNTLNLEYRTDLFKKDTINRILNHYINLLNNIGSNMDTKIRDISIISEEERNMILHDFNNTYMEFPKDKTVVQLFEEQVEKTPDNIAVVFEDKKLTYKELNEKANGLALYLRKNNVGRNDIVSIMVNRSLELIVSIIGVLKSGACYIPIDPNFPKDRIEYMLNNSNSKLLLTDSYLYKNITFENKLIIDLSNYTFETTNYNLENINTPEDMSYIIYTSGSTGKPKGVILRHKSLTNLAYYLKNNVCFFKDFSYISIASITTVSFDIFIFETLMCLQNGLKVILANEDEQRLPNKLNNLIKQNNVKAIQMTPSRMKMFLDSITDCPNLSNLEYIILAGEPLPDSLLQDLLKLNVKKVYNGYGPSETTVFSTFTDVTNYTHINIGKPLSNTKMYILDKDLCPVPLGISGELYIAGDGVGKGYLNNDILTNEKFIVNPFENDSIMYRTGDVCKFLDNGEICYLERLDNQIKIRGLRIELGEIENKLLELPFITKVKVVKQSIKNRDFISAYYISTTNVNINELRKFLSKELPDYMIPSYFTELNAFPYTPNGKIDKNALPLPDISLNEDETIYIAPNTETEINLVNILEKLLNVTHIGMKDNFFHLGGDSLTAILLCSNIKRIFNVELSFKDVINNPIVEDLVHIISNADCLENPSSIKNYSKRDFYPVSSAQKRMYLSSNVDNTSTLYNISGGILLDTLPDINKFQKSLDLIRFRHASLRSYFEMVNGEIVQKYIEDLQLKINVEKVDTNDINELFEKYNCPFNLSTAPLWNIHLLHLPNDKAFIILNAHHIILDGTSLNNLIEEISNAYNDKSLPELSISYTDYSIWEQEQLLNDGFKSSKDFWINQFKDDIPILNMPTTYQRPATKNYEGNTFVTNISKELTKKISNFALENNITPYMVMLSAYYILLYKYTSQEDIIIGSPISGRLYKELEPLLGMFVNSLPLRNRVSSDLKFSEFLSNVKNSCIEAFSHQDYPFDVLVNELNITRDNSRSPLFDTIFNYQNNGFKLLDFNGINAEFCIPTSNTAKFDLSLDILPEDDVLKLSFEYCTKLFDEDFINRFSKHYLNILNNVLNQPNTKISDICIISDEECKQILYDFNNTKVDYPKSKTIIKLFEEQVQKTPNNIAVVFEDKQLTYQELNDNSNKLARLLLDNNCKIGDKICIALDKSLEMIISIIGILKIGGTFLPIDINYPKDRIDYIIDNSNANILLTTKNLINDINDSIRILDVSFNNIKLLKNSTDNLNINYSPDNLAYVMYTSGSTGKPKGVMVTHTNVIRLVKNNRFIRFQDNEHILQTGSIVFDACTFEIWGALLNGYQLFIIEKELLLDTAYLKNYMEKNKITSLFITTQLFNQLVDLDIDIFSHVSNVLTGGEAVSVKHMNRLNLYNKNINIIHCYGPTENTTFSTCYDVKKVDYKYNIPIGKPISNSTAYVMDAYNNLCPIGVPGELWVGGDGVANGYLNNETLTKEKFIDSPFDDGKIYKTGDLVKWLPDGNIEFIGRIDNQVKVRGFRIELSEIDSKMLDYPNIKYSTTILNTINDEKVICSYFVADKTIDINELKEFLKGFLPNYMIPTYILQMESFKMNINGKIDKKTLPTDFKVLKSKKVIEKPKNEFEKNLLKVYNKIINIDDISVTDNLFDDLHGDSLIAMKIQVEALSQNINIAYSDIFKYPTIRLLANHLKDTISENDEEFSINGIDFSKYDSILKSNSLEKPIVIKNTPVKNLLLTGFTGFLGAHILDSFIKKESGTIYCLIRGKNNMSVKDRLLDVLHFYFADKYDKFIGNRIMLVEGDISEEYLGLSLEEYNSLGKKIDTIIHSAALVKHYGMYKDFENANVIGTKNIVEFATKFDIRLLHVSTLSVSGNNFADGAHVDNNFGRDVDFSESDFYIGQTLGGIYAKSKFLAEKIVLDAILDSSLNACILRMGNLTSRFSEGKFQQNHFENAFVNRFKSFLQIGYAPDYMLGLYAEFTPIDYCGDAIIEIAKHFNKDYTVFHVMNEKRLYLDKLFEMMNKLNIELKVVTESEFIKVINELLLDENKKTYIEGIINDFDKTNKHLVYESEVQVKCDFSKEFLKEIGFEWPYIDINYIRNYFKYLKNIGYLNIDLK